MKKRTTTSPYVARGGLEKASPARTIETHSPPGIEKTLNIMLRVFSTPAHESSQFILKLQFSDPCRAPGKLLFVPLHTETPIKKYILFRGT